MAITQLIAALAWAALRAPQAGDEEVTGDIGGLLLAFVLGITYVDFMAFLVMWYSDLPSRMVWFVQREGILWSAVAVAGFVFGSAAPILALLLARVRNDVRPLRAVAVSVLAGLAFSYAYMIVPPFGARALGAAALAVIAIGLIVTAAASWPTSAPSLLSRARAGE